MKIRKLIAAIAACAVAAGTLATVSFADIDYPLDTLTSTTFDNIASWATGQWLIGSDNEGPENPLTVADLEAADSFEISYTCEDPVPPTLSGEGPTLTIVFKFATAFDEEGKPSEYAAVLQPKWFDYGPNAEGTYAYGVTYQAFDYSKFNLDENGGTISISTDTMLSIFDGNIPDGTVLWQFGIGSNSYDYDTDWVDLNAIDDHFIMNITGVKLVGNTDGDDDDDTTADDDDDTTADDDDTTADDDDDTTADDDDDTTADDDDDDAGKDSPDTGVEGIAAIAGLAVIAAGAVIVTRRRK